MKYPMRITSCFLTALCLCTVPLKLFSQEERVFGNLNSADSIILIGMFDPHKKARKRAKYDFILTDPVVIDSFLKTFVLGKSEGLLPNSAGFEIMIVNSNTKEVFTSYTINMKESQIDIYGKGYKINLDYLKKLHETYPLKYRVQKTSFRRAQDYEITKPLLLKDKDCVLIDPPSFKFEGKFQVKFQMETEVKSFEDASEYLKSQMLEIQPDRNFLIFYLAIETENLKAGKDITINGLTTKAAYDQLYLKKGKKLKWVPDKHEANIYYKQ